MSELFTIGYSVHSIERFIDLLKMHGITVLCDVRSSPYSRFVPQFNRESLKAELAKHRIAYIHLGAELGPRSSDPACYENGKVRYDWLAETALFQKGLYRLRKGLASHRITLMCAEKDPLICHRMILICRRLRKDALSIRHILEDGSLLDHPDAEVRLMKVLGIPAEDLFSTREDQIARAYDIQEGKIAYTLPEEEGQKIPWPMSCKLPRRVSSRHSRCVYSDSY